MRPLLLALLFVSSFVTRAHAQWLEDPLHHTLLWMADESGLALHTRLGPLVRVPLGGAAFIDPAIPQGESGPIAMTSNRAAYFTIEYGLFTHAGRFAQVRFAQVSEGSGRVYGRDLTQAAYGISDQGLRLSPSGRFLGIFSADGPPDHVTYRVFDTRTRIAVHESNAVDAALLGETATVIVLASGEVKWFDLATRREIAALPPVPGTRRSIVHGVSDGVAVFETRGGAKVLAILRLEGTEIARNDSAWDRADVPIAVSSDGRLVAAQPVRSLPECMLAASLLGCRPFGSLPARAPTITILDRASGAERAAIRGQREYTRVLFSPSGRRIAVLARIVHDGPPAPFELARMQPVRLDVFDLTNGASLATYGDGARSAIVVRNTP